MLDGAGNAAGDVQRGRHGLARLAHLVLDVDPALVHGRARGAHGGPQGIGQRLDDREALRPLAAAAAGHDDVRLGQIDALGGGAGHGLHDAGEVGCVDRGRDDLGGAGGVGLGHRKRLRTHRGHHGGGDCGCALDHLGGVGQAREDDLVAGLDIHHVREQRRIQGLGQKRGRYARFGAVGEQYHGRGALDGQPGQRAGHGAGRPVEGLEPMGKGELLPVGEVLPTLHAMG